MYQYKAKLIRVIDGDTVDLEVDLGFRIKLNARIRLEGINTPEITGVDKEKGLEVKKFVEELFSAESGVCTLMSFKTEKYGRWLGRIYLPNASCVNDLIEDFLNAAQT